MQEKTFTGADLEKALMTGALTKSGTELVGMVKSSEKAGYVSFTRSGCDSWVDLPASMIEQAEKLGQSVCKDHSHPVVKIILKEATNPEAQILSALLAQSMPIPSQTVPIPTQGGQGSLPQIYSEIQGRGAFGNPFFGINPEGSNDSFIVPLLQTFARIGGGVISGGVKGGSVNFGCNRGGCRCDGVWDCLDMLSTSVCGGDVKCYTGWVTGQVVCTCSR